jgi:ribosomal protein S27AE
MNFIGTYLSRNPVFLATAFVGAVAGLDFDTRTHLHRLQSTSAADQIHACPMHADVVQKHPRGCPKCGMVLARAGQTQAGREQCGNSGEKHLVFSADKNAPMAPTRSRLPPGHPLIPGRTVEPSPTPDSEPATPEGAIRSSASET